MIEIMFTENYCSPLEDAKKKNGEIGDIFCLPLMFDYADISDGMLSEKRKESLSGYLRGFPEVLNYITEKTEQAGEILNTITERAEAGEPVRIWYSSDPCEYCGFFWIVSEIQKRLKRTPEISSVRLHDFLAVGGNVVTCREVDIVPEGELERVLSSEEIIDSNMIELCSSKWNDLQRENSPVRAKLNGTIVSVSEDFYDYFIYNEYSSMPDTFSESDLIEKIISKYPFGVTRLWIVLRLERLMKQGFLMPLTDSDSENNLLGRTLKKI